MAVTKILAVRNRLDKRVAYVVNSEKTHLATDITYVTNPEKTEQSFFTSAINCRSVQTAFAEMMATKQRFRKTDGVQAYHIIQSFAPGEVTPEQAHRIGLQLCERLFENRYEVVIGTHLDKAHLHNHILVNSVAKDNGAKYHSNRQSYYQQIRRISDELCREEQLSVIEPHSNGQPYPAWKNQKTGKPTLSQMLRDEIDLVIRDCVSFPDFLDLLEKKGYVVSRNTNRKYLTVRPPGAKRNFRLDRLGQGYTVEDIKQRIQHQLVQRSRRYPVRPQTSHRRVSGSWQTARKKKITGFHALYLRYVYLLRKYKRPTRKKISYEMRREVLRLERYQALEEKIKEYGASELIYFPYQSTAMRIGDGQAIGNYADYIGGCLYVDEESDLERIGTAVIEGRMPVNEDEVLISRTTLSSALRLNGIEGDSIEDLAAGLLETQARRRVTPGTVTGIAAADGFSNIIIDKYLMNREIGFTRKVLAILEEEGVAYEHIPSGIDSISVLMRGEKFTSAKEKKVVARIKRELAPDSVIVTHDYAVVMVVGEGMAFSSGMLAKATGALAEHGINISMVNQGASEISFMIGIKGEDRDKAVRALYAAFFEK